MRHGVWWTLVLLGLPGIAVADGATGAAAKAIPPGSQPRIERAETPAAIPPPALDLRFDPTQLPSRAPSIGPRTIGTDRVNRSPGAVPDATDRGLSFGVEVQPRSRIGNLARENEANDPGLEDDLQRLIDRATLGVRGRYRF